jgi:hypothetical protein
MTDVSGKFFSAKKVRTGVSPSSPGVQVGETLPPVNPPGTSLNSVGLTMPSAFAVANSPLTSNGTIAVTGAGTVAQYVRGDGTLADFPESSGGGSSVSYYLNGSVSQGTIGGVAYREMNKVPILGAGTDFTIAADGYISSFITDAGDPNLLEIPGGNWNFESYFSASSGGGSPTFYVELYKVNAGGTATLIASNSANPELISFGTTIAPYFSSLAVPTTVLALTDRLAVRYYVTHSGRTITLHTEGPHLCQIITTFTTGLTALNGLTSQVQFFAVGTSGTDFNIASATATHTFHLPTASATNRGALSSADWSTFNNKENAITAGTTAQYFRGDKTFQTLNTSVVPEGTNLYYTDGRARGALSFAAGSGAYNTSTGVITIPTNNNQITNGAGYITSAGTITGASGALTSKDNRTISPSEDNAGQLKFGFTSWANNDDAPYADYLHLRSYTDSSGGNDNLVMFFKSAIGMRIYQQSFGSATAYSSFKDIAFTDGTNASGTWGINITGNASTANTWSTARTITIGNTGKSVNGSSNVSWSLAEIGAQAALTNPVTGTGTTNYVPKFTGASTIGDSNIVQSGIYSSFGTTATHGNVTINQTTGEAGLVVNSIIAETPTLYLRDAGGNGYSRILANNNLVLDASKVLIGTTTDAGFKLDVNGTGRFLSSASGGQTLRLQTTVSAGRNYVQWANPSGDMGYIGYGGADGKFYIYNQLNHDMLFYTNSSPRMTITSGGNVGIGTTAPVNYTNYRSLHISGSASNSSAILYLTNSTESIRGLFFAEGSAQRVTIGSQSDHPFTIVSNDIERIRINSTNGNVGIKTENPNSTLQVQGSFSTPHTTKSANYTLDATDYTVGFDCASNRTANLPDATTCAGRIYVIYQYNTNNGARYVTLDGNGSQTINGLTTVNLQYYGDFSSVMIQSNGSNWVVISDALYFIPV